MILDKPFPPDWRIENEAFSLMQKGHEVWLYCLDFSSNQSEYELLDGIHIYRKRLWKFFYSLCALAYSVPFYHSCVKKSIRQFIQDQKIDVLHIHDMQIARPVFQLNRKFRLPIVLDLHENRPEIMKYYAHVNSLWGRLLIRPSVWKHYEFKYIHAADRIVVVTKEAKEYYVSVTKTIEDKFFVVPNTVRIPFFTDYRIDQKIIERYSGGFNLLYIGETGLRRGIETMILSLKHLIPQIPDIRLIIVGKSKTDHILRDLISEMGYSKYVDLVGWENLNLFQSYILASNVCTCPIHKNIHHDTTYANKLFQYMSLGKPLVVSNCTAQANLVTTYNCGLVFEDRNPLDFANQILKLYHDKTLTQLLGENGRTAVIDDLCWEKQSNQLIKLYESL